MLDAYRELSVGARQLLRTFELAFEWLTEHCSRLRRSLTVTAGGYTMIFHPYPQSAYMLYELEWYRVSFLTSLSFSRDVMGLFFLHRKAQHAGNVPPVCRVTGKSKEVE